MTKSLRWVGSALAEIREFPEAARSDAGFQKSQKTSSPDFQTGRLRYREMIAMRSREGL